MPKVLQEGYWSCRTRFLIKQNEKIVQAVQVCREINTDNMTREINHWFKAPPWDLTLPNDFSPSPMRFFCTHSGKWPAPSRFHVSTTEFEWPRSNFSRPQRKMSLHNAISGAHNGNWPSTSGFFVLPIRNETFAKSFNQNFAWLDDEWKLWTFLNRLPDLTFISVFRAVSYLIAGFCYRLLLCG
jgi:hypothetical protein